MKVYDFLMRPLEKHFLHQFRKEYMAYAHGNVLEIGVGTGANLPFYDFDKIESYTGIDVNISDKLSNYVSDKIEFVQGFAEKLPFEDNRFDTVVLTLVLCSVTNPTQALTEIDRVLAPDGKFVFIEHIIPSDKKLAKLFVAINPVWKKIGKGCHLSRATDIMIKNSAFKTGTIHKRAKGILCYGVMKRK